MNKAFFLVWCPSGVNPPKYRHETRELAIKEAKRLAREHPGSHFYVLAAIDRLSVTDIDHQVLVVDDGIPF